MNLPKLNKLEHIPSIDQIKESINAMDYLLDNGIYNDDIHIDNIMELNRNLILIDFGRALYMSDLKYNYDKIKMKTLIMYRLSLSFVHHIINLGKSFSYSEIDIIFKTSRQINFSDMGSLGEFLSPFINCNK